ncbi:Uncharacterized protein DBV15_08256 [Temnothorax longispinosus]|uniref:Uncharacterized protein n=1 Tax=Temnothorax longispinosus TaxID=300112 RepID=A0A4S2KIR7_9HYME|nr:Uncharacterized protein DBV15_08256 [Temnothorax longispinosus]
MQLTLSSSAAAAAAYSRRHFYGANAGAAAQSARLASESSYRSSIRESAIRQPPELLLEMERPGYNGVQRGRHLKVKYLRGGGRERGKRERAGGGAPEISREISRHFVPSLISFGDRRLHPINASSYNAARSILPNWLRLAQLNWNQLIGGVIDVKGCRDNVVRAATKMVRFSIQRRMSEFRVSFCKRHQEIFR